VARASIELHRIAADVAKIPDAGLIAAAKLAKRVVDDAARADVGGDMAGKHRRPIKLRARDKGIRPIERGRAVLVVGTPAGPWVWRNTGTDAHMIRRRKRGPMRKMSVRHPGTRGRGTWRGVVERCSDLVPRIFTEAVGQAVN